MDRHTFLVASGGCCVLDYAVARFQLSSKSALLGLLLLCPAPSHPDKCSAWLEEGLFSSRLHVETLCAQRPYGKSQGSTWWGNA